MQVKVTLGKHCIEGASREKYHALVQALLTGNAEPEQLEPQLTLLEEFLKTVDFPALRSQYRDLDGRREVEVTVTESGDGFVLEWDRGQVKVEKK